ncbi:MAG: gamma-glutamyl-gamma-aminobutyrate hydrolase family protein, partial [Oscillibacter sp.]|nr:gamma-glutamyl-gamma-aminobutyrate hydrolase family protein [Oscillibacter sp.]
ADEGGELMVNSAHHQAADRLGVGLTAVQWAPDGIVEAVVHRTLPVWGVQWHPERLPGAVGRVLFRGFTELCER